MRFHKRKPMQQTQKFVVASVVALSLLTLLSYLTLWTPLMRSDDLIVRDLKDMSLQGERESEKHYQDPKVEKNTSSSSMDTFFLASSGYTIPGCSCVRFGLDLKSIGDALRDAKKRPDQYPSSFLEKYAFQGQSTCSDYSTQRGAGQNVVSYSYYSPEGKADPNSQHFKKYLGQLHGKAGAIKEFYPGWNMRIYHNITMDDDEGNKFLCKIFCGQQHVDFCNVNELPGIGNLMKQNAVGRVWRFAVMGDPTVSKFLIRDSDSFILDREVAVVKDWLTSNKSFHVIRDHPNHKAVMLAGLWGGSNKDQDMMRKLRDEMFSQPLNLTTKFDQYLLATRVWPLIKNDTMQHDSYNCMEEGHEGSLPFPVKRFDGLYCGWGPFKFRERKKVFNTKCHVECRPENHQDWMYC